MRELETIAGGDVELVLQFYETFSRFECALNEHTSSKVVHMVSRVQIGMISRTSSEGVLAR
jgi:hypothetical protein